MNKYQWALHRLWSAINRNEYLIYDKQLMEELVEKVTPKKAIPIKGWKYMYVCPSCEENIVQSQYYDKKYCPYCGQALDWSEEE